MKVIRQTSLVLSILFFLSLRAYGAGKTATGFYWPTGTDGYYKGYASFLGNGCSPHRGSYDFYIAEKYHLGEDIAGNFDDPVYAIADGIVVDKDTGSSWGESSQGLFVRSRLHTGEEFVWLMGHITSSLQKNDRVTAGQVIGKIAIKNNPHAHLGVLNGTVIPLSAWGAMPCSNWSPDKSVPTTTNGFVDPIGWITTQIPSFSATWHPNGTLIRAAGDDKVYYLKRDGTTGKLKRRHIVSETVFTNSGYNWNEIVVVSSQERDCFDEGAKVTAPESDLLKARLVIPEGDYKVYAISENQLRWLNLTPEEFVSVGYQWGNVGTLHANHNIPYGVSLTMQDFRTCERNKQSPPPPPPPAKKANGATCSDRSECASNWCQPIPDGTKYCMSERKSCSVPGSDGIATWEFQTFGGQVYQCQPGNVYAPWVSPIVLSGTIANGQVCDPANPKQCSSGYCEIGPDAHYCVGPKSHCAKPGTEGSKWNESYVYNGKTYDCMFPSGIISRNANRDVPDGMLCLDWKDCASRCCFPGPRDRFYCVNAKKNCVQPGKEGVMYRDTFLYDHILYECVSPGETVEIGP